MLPSSVSVSRATRCFTALSPCYSGRPQLRSNLFHFRCKSIIRFDICSVGFWQLYPCINSASSKIIPGLFFDVIVAFFSSRFCSLELNAKLKGPTSDLTVIRNVSQIHTEHWSSELPVIFSPNKLWMSRAEVCIDLRHTYWLNIPWRNAYLTLCKSVHNFLWYCEIFWDLLKLRVQVRNQFLQLQNSI